MKVLLALVLALSMTFMFGCQGAKPEVGAGATSTGQSSEKPTEKVGEPVVITPDPGPLAAIESGKGAESMIDATDGVDEKEAAVVGAYYLRAHLEAKLADAYGDTSEAYTLLNQVKVMSEWLLTYSRTSVDGKPADAYAATIVVDTKSGKMLRVTEAP